MSCIRMLRMTTADYSSYTIGGSLSDVSCKNYRRSFLYTRLLLTIHDIAHKGLRAGKKLYRMLATSWKDTIEY